MCRILGVSLANNDEKMDIAEIAATLFPALVRQGPHAYGWMSYDPNTASSSDNRFGQFEGAKYVGRSDTDQAWKNIMYGVNPKARWLIGHTRFATHGDPKDLLNDHPIPHGNIVGVHNGVLRNHEEILAITGRENEETEVDSEAIFAAVNKWGPTKGLRKIQGDMVALFANQATPGIFRIARTHGRQLTLGFTTKGNLIFASDQWALRLLEPEIKFHHFTTISENRLLVIKDGKIVSRSTFRTPPKRAAEPRVFAYTPPPARIMVPTARAGGDDIVTAAQDLIAHRITAADYLSIVDRREQRRASARGELLFPRGSNPRMIVSQGKSRKGKERDRRKAASRLKDAVREDLARIDAELDAINRGQLFYKDGQLLTAEEYREVIESES